MYIIYPLTFFSEWFNFHCVLLFSSDINAKDLYLKINSAWQLKIDFDIYRQKITKLCRLLLIASMSSIHVNPTWTCGLCAIPRRPPPRLTPPDYNSYRAYYPRSQSARYFCGASAYTRTTHARRHEMRLTCVRIRARNIHLAAVGRVCMRMHICICMHASVHSYLYVYVTCEIPHAEYLPEPTSDVWTP